MRVPARPTPALGGDKKGQTTGGGVSADWRDLCSEHPGVRVFSETILEATVLSGGYFIK